MSSKAFDIVPLIRIPLALNSGLGLILSAVSAACLDSHWSWSDDLLHAIDAMVAFYAASLTYSAALIFVDRRRGNLRLPLSPAHISPMAALVRAAVDGTLGFTLLVLHILVSINVAHSEDSVLHMYSGFSALPAR